MGHPNWWTTLLRCGNLNIAALLSGVVCDIRVTWRMPNGRWLSR